MEHNGKEDYTTVHINFKLDMGEIVMFLCFSPFYSEGNYECAYVGLSYVNTDHTIPLTS